MLPENQLHHDFLPGYKQASKFIKSRWKDFAYNVRMSSYRWNKNVISLSMHLPLAMQWLGQYFFSIIDNGDTCIITAALNTQNFVRTNSPACPYFQPFAEPLNIEL